jgi:aminopeptidase 2
MYRNGNDVASASLDIRRGREVLPKNVKPLHYDLTLEPNFETFKYEGTVIIDFDVVEDSTSIALNTVEIDIHETLVEANGATISSSPTLDYNKDTQTTTVTFDKTMTWQVSTGHHTRTKMATPNTLLPPSSRPPMLAAHFLAWTSQL